MKVDGARSKRWIHEAEKALKTRFDPEAQALGVVGDDNKLLCVMVFHGASMCSCEISCVTFGPAPFTRSVLRQVFRYPFETCGYRRIHSVVSVNNPRSIDLTRRLGLSVEGLLRNWYPDGSDGIMHGMLKEECKWLK